MVRSKLTFHFKFFVFGTKFHSEPASDAESSIIHSSIESGVKVVREFGCASVNAVKDKKKPVDDFIATGIGHSQCKSIMNKKNAAVSNRHIIL